MAQLPEINGKIPFVVALDKPWEESKKWIPRLKDEVWGFKVGSILFTEMGPKVIETILESGAQVFLDLKFHDIPNTVQFAAKAAFSWGVQLLTIHACGGPAMLHAAAQEQGENSAVLAVTVLTSLNSDDLSVMNMSGTLESRVQLFTELTVKSGVKGIVCSPHEVADIRKKYPQLIILSPGIRFDISDDDQKRTATAKDVFNNGANYGVLGRALTDANDWKQTWHKIRSSLEGISFSKPSIQK